MRKPNGATEMTAKRKPRNPVQKSKQEREVHKGQNQWERAADMHQKADHMKAFPKSIVKGRE
jgi:hypothetical protein